MTTDPGDLQQRKLKAEVEKLEGEARKVGRWEPKDKAATVAAIASCFTALSVVVATISAFWSGVLTSKAEQLKLQEMRLHEVERSIAAKEETLAATTRRVSELEASETALSRLNSAEWNLDVFDKEIPDGMEYVKQLSQSGSARSFAFGWRPKDNDVYRVQRPLDVHSDDSVHEKIGLASKVAGLTELGIFGCRLWEPDFQSLGKIEGLKSLAVCNAGVPGSWLKHLSQLVRLEHLDLSGNPLETFDELPAFPELKRLRLTGIEISPEQLTLVLSKLPSVKELNLSGSSASDEHIKTIGSFKQIKQLHIAYTSVTAKALCEIGPSLDILEASSEMIPVEEDLKRLDELMGGARFNLINRLLLFREDINL